VGEERLGEGRSVIGKERLGEGRSVIGEAIVSVEGAVAESGGAIVLARLRELPGGEELLRVAESRGEGVELVGGAVRDILLGTAPRELDVVVTADVGQLAGALAAQLDGQLTLHERFGTALVRSARVNIDLATVRAESYRSPGALPEVRSATVENDLARRDFTVNAIAVSLAGRQRGKLRSVAGALEDLRARRLRVLHDASFRDDPTRLLRMARYRSRLGFEVESHTQALAAQALEMGALQTVSAQRLGAELRLALAEPDAIAALAELDRAGLLAAWQPGLRFDERVARTALEILPEDGSTQLLLATSLLLDLSQRLEREESESAMLGFLHDLELPAGEGDKVFDAAVRAGFAIGHIERADTLEGLLEVAQDAPVESLALAGAVRDLRDGGGSRGRKVVDEWLNHQRHVKLKINGDDLIAAGVPEGPEIGLRLDRAYRMLLAQEIEPGREPELRAALEAQI
jgi:tRNA nucleotidyltransferase (CCA-adding enzyme)